MIENGHFVELETIVRLTQRNTRSAGMCSARPIADIFSLTVGPDDDDPIFAANANTLSETAARDDMQTFVFSATLSKDLQQNLKKRQRSGAKTGKKASALGESADRHYLER